MINLAGNCELVFLNSDLQFGKMLDGKMNGSCQETNIKNGFLKNTVSGSA